MKILIIAEGYFPGKKYGGPPVSIKNFCKLMSEYDCHIITKNHDLGEKESYKNIGNGIIKEDNCTITYLNDKEYNIKTFKEKIIEIKPDIIYLQGLFQKCIIPTLILAKKYKIKVLLAPRGELCKGAFKKKYKKIPYIIGIKFLGLLKNVSFQATSQEEYNAISKILKIKKNRIYQLTNIPTSSTSNLTKIKKEKNSANIIFLSRIVEKKNLHYALEVLKKVKGKIVFDIYGPIEDNDYWTKCKKIIETMPKNITVNYKGIVTHDKIEETFNKYHTFIFPTFSENYGHVIVESLTAGCPIIISDQTPFTDINNLIKNSAISIKEQKKYINKLQEIIDYNDLEWKDVSKKSREYIKDKLNMIEIKKDYQNAINDIVANSIKYIVSYDVPENNKENRLNIPSSANKIDYIINTLNKIGYKVEIISTSQTLNKKCYKGKTINFNNNTLKLFPTTWRGKFILKTVNQIVMRTSIIFYLTKNIKKNDKIIIYHSLGNLWILRYLKKCKKVEIIEEVEEIYNLISNNQKQAKKEIKYLKLADKYIFPTKIINDVLKIKNIKSIVVHGSYIISNFKEYNDDAKFDENKINIGYTGLIDKKKGCFEIIKTGSLLDENYHIHILGFGDKTEIEKMKKIISEENAKNKCQISYDGIRKGKDYDNYLKKLDIGICSIDSSKEYADVQFPSKIISYLTANLKVICSSNKSVKTSDVAEAINFYEGNTPKQIAEVIKKCKNTQNNSQTIIKKCDEKFKIELKKLIEEK